MARYVLHAAQGPSKIKIGDEYVEICRCGLTRDKDGLCDESHHFTINEEQGKIYKYDETLNREEFDLDDKGGCCKGTCSGNCAHN